MLEHPPLIPSRYTPEDLVGSHNMAALAAHIVHFEANKDKPGRKVNQQMGEIISRLMAHGYMIDGFKKDGSIWFRTILKGKCQQEMEGPVLDRLKELPISELQEMGRGGYRQIIKQQEEFKLLKN